ncbi:MAG: hypothetical protein ACRERV_05395 [Methylococcales bacterium]
MIEKQAHTGEDAAHNPAVAASGRTASPMALRFTALVWIPHFKILRIIRKFVPIYEIING